MGRLASAQKRAAPGSPAYSVYVNRRIGKYLAAWAYRAGLTPNAVTAISAVFTFSGIVVLALAPLEWFTGLVVAALLVVGYAFDSADGQVARLRGGGSLAGEWLDHVVDAVKIATLHVAVLVTLFLHVEALPTAVLLIPLGYSVVATVSFFAFILSDQLRSVYASRGFGRAPRGESTIIRSLMVVPTDYGVLCLVFVLLAAPAVFLVVYALMFLANAGYLVLASHKWFRDMGRLDERTAH
ncbi:CDP-alcohol phosphatidyltransferase family protein [Subtercola lobariae]|uniref:CDP-alcohol phosphatidyltransferase family protein n=1 Tax=Subtercola lobariae TaxID=1588641 RepID=UPI001E56B71E|nr:CDP-alcohol phosphatidyltransferase family protein [Subtercola lobariae]